MAEIWSILVMVLEYWRASKGKALGFLTGDGDLESVALCYDIMLNFKSEGSKATVPHKELSSGIALGMSEDSGRAAMRKNLCLPFLTSSKMRQK